VKVIFKKVYIYHLKENYMDLLLRDETIFKNEEVFDLDYVPEHVLYRDSQLQALRFNLQPALRGGRPINTLCIGTVATGKTTVVRKIFQALEEETQKVIPVYINCQISSKKYSVVSCVYNRIFGHFPPRSGVSFEKIFTKVVKNLAERKRTVVIALDDIQYLFPEREIDAVLYSLLRAHEYQEGAKIGVFAIYSGERMDYQLDPRVYSVFMPEEIRFHQYTREEVREILSYRVKEGFYPGVIGDEVLEYVVEAVCSSGDLRVGINLLRRGGENAERRASRKISLEDVEKAYEKSRYVHLSSILGSLRKEEKILLKIICDSEPAKAGDLQKRFLSATGLGYTTFHETLKRLENLKLIKLDFTGKGRKGRSRIPKLRYEKEEILKRI
jgi:cell division control protein 6